MIAKDSIDKALNGNYANDRMGSIEELQATVELLKEALVECLTVLVNVEAIKFDELKKALDNGYLLREE